MSSSGSLIPPEFEEYIHRRKELWAQYDSSQKDAAQLRTLSFQVTNKTQGEDIDSLTSEQMIPLELTRAVQELEQELEQIDKLKGSISDSNSTIQQIEEHYQNMMRLLIGAGVVFVIIMLFMLF